MLSGQQCVAILSTLEQQESEVLKYGTSSCIFFSSRRRTAYRELQSMFMCLCTCIKKKQLCHSLDFIQMADKMAFPYNLVSCDCTLVFCCLLSKRAPSWEVRMKVSNGAQALRCQG